LPKVILKPFTSQRKLPTIIKNPQSSGKEAPMQTNNIPKGTFQITLTNALQYLIMGLFYIAVTKTNALTQTDIGALSILSFLSSTIILITGLALPTALTKFASEKLGKNQTEEAASVQKTVTKTVLALSLTGFITLILFSNQLSQFLLGSSIHANLIILMLVYTLFFSIITLFKSTLQALYLFGKMATVTLIFIIVSRTKRKPASRRYLFHMFMQKNKEYSS